jgi:hypothetical protein
MHSHSVILNEVKDLTSVRIRTRLKCDAEWLVGFLAPLGMTSVERAALTNHTALHITIGGTRAVVSSVNERRRRRGALH